MSTDQSSNKRIAKNTLMLYIRMLISMLVGLYTSRVVLQTLGVVDYGIYGVVGGIVTMFSFLNSAMAGATSRFLTFEMGKEKTRKDEKTEVSNEYSSEFSNQLSPLRKTFSSAMIIHIGIAFIIVLLALTIGLWFLSNKLVIPEERMLAAYWVYFCSIIGMVISVTQVPYNAAIIAHENMDVYAYVELFNAFLKLGIVYLLLIGNFDKLVLYALLMLGVGVIIALIYRIYCLKRYKETHFNWIFDKQLLKPMLKFTGWDLLGHFGYSFRTQGTSMIINMFFGAAVNAAGSLASTVQAILFNFSNTIITAVKPQIVKRYSQGDYIGMSSLIFSSIKINLLLVLLMTLPVVLNIGFIFHIWLSDVPEYCIDFCKIMLWSNIVSSVSQIIYSGIQAVGDLKKTSIIRNIVYIGTPFLIFLVFRFGYDSPNWAYYIVLVSQILLSLCDTAILSSLLPFFRKINLFIIVLKVGVITLVSYTITYCVSDCVGNVWANLSVSCLVAITSVICGFYYCVFCDYERKMVTDCYLNIKKKIMR